ncbi:hypothetical protein L1987_06748 [Smallanthus sonchifolius]|uniref:Uncharacterized protein n=1 Tax=Smallanthus sonchifolius TaxID=185202 RepID=A0ACB9JZ04_9ASTR|nr:hypothetical protein L1987_06748 [Smallanthus sonchifolius]
MDSNTKMRKGFIKGKLAMSFYRASKPPTTTTVATKTFHIKPSTLPPSSLIKNQQKVNPPPPKHKVSYVIPQTTGTYGVFDNPYGVVVDEAVDAKAATYISCVQERFKLEHNVNNELVEPTS